MDSTSVSPRTRGRRWFRSVIAALSLAALSGIAASAQDNPPERAQELLIATHVRLHFEKDIKRVAVADPEIIQFEPLSEREVLVLGKSLGRTSVMVWFADGEAKGYLFHVRRDLSLLEEALKDIHPSITVQSAPDRDAVVLRGNVPDITYSNAAEETAQRYLDARKGGRRKVTPSVKTPGEAPATPGGAPGATPGAAPAPTVESVAQAPEYDAAVINLIRVEQLPGRLEERMQAAIGEVGAADVHVQRLIRGRIADDEKDVFVLTGTVESQSALVRVISVAQSLLGNRGGDQMKVIADEAGALREGEQAGATSLRGSTVPALSQLFSGNMGQNLRNMVGANLGRAKVVEAAGGRILSFLEVSDLPQVRVDIRLYEVNCSKLRSFGSNWGGIVSNFSTTSLNPSVPGRTLQGAAAPRVGAQGENPDVQNVLGFLSGALTNQFQIAGENFAFDWLLSLLEEKGFARSLSRPSLTVLSGESALFQVGGEIPVPTSFATNVATEGVFNSVVFRPFGVQLAVRPLVGEEGDVTLDLAPTVSLPDAQLTAGIREATGQTQTTASFRTRSLQTTARLLDGQSLLVGGLISRNVNSTDTATPGLSDLPGVGAAFSGYQRQGDEFQLIVAVHPVVLRKPDTRSRSWAFPTPGELLSGSASGRVR